jgi:hypothetical protein
MGKRFFLFAVVAMIASALVCTGCQGVQIKDDAAVRLAVKSAASNLGYMVSSRPMIWPMRWPP